MLKPSYTRQFERDLKKCLKRGKDEEKIKIVISTLINEEKLEPKYRDHKLTGSYKGRRECQIEPDWLLISRKYKKTFTDLLYKVKLRGRDLYVVILLEFKSAPALFVAVQMVGYILDFYWHLIDSDRENQALHRPPRRDHTNRGVLREGQKHLVLAFPLILAFVTPIKCTFSCLSPRRIARLLGSWAQSDEDGVQTINLCSWKTLLYTRWLSDAANHNRWVNLAVAHILVALLGRTTPQICHLLSQD